MPTRSNRANVLDWQRLVSGTGIPKMKQVPHRRFGSPLALAVLGLSVLTAHAETCVTQSQMKPAERDALAASAKSLALKVQANDQPGVRAATIPEYAKDFSGIASTISDAASTLKGATPEVEQVYLLDASANKRNPDGTATDAQFFCSLNKSPLEADFNIGSLPPGRYAFAMVRFSGAHPALLSLLLRQDAAASPWQLAGLYPRPTTAAGHDGLWYWKQARTLAAGKQPWSAYVFYQEAQNLLQPAGFVSSTHLENLRSERTTATPPPLANGLGPDNPLILKGSDGAEYRVTALLPDNTLSKDKIDVAAHLKVDSLGDANTARQRNLSAMSALLAAHPELRQSFHGVWIFSDAPRPESRRQRGRDGTRFIDPVTPGSPSTFSYVAKCCIFLIGTQAARGAAASHTQP